MILNGDHKTMSSSGIRFNFFDTSCVAPMFDSMVSRIDPITPLLLLVDHFDRSVIQLNRPSDYKKEIKAHKVGRIAELDTVPWNPHIKTVNSQEFNHECTS